MLKTPIFWYKEKSILGLLLSPIGWLYNAISQFRHQLSTPSTSDIPVLCIGNLTIGGSGKTPVAISLCEILKAHGKVPHFVSRGYGGTYKEVLLQVDPSIHPPGLVGDEPFLLASHAPTWVTQSRTKAIAAAQDAGADIVILDDGFQNPSVTKDFSIVVIDGPNGFGNGHVFPAGPLREKIVDGLRRANIAVVLGKGSPLKNKSIPIISAEIKPKNHQLNGKKVVAFAGIGIPKKFFTTLENEGAIIVREIAFPDHHTYTQKDEKYLLAEAKTQETILVTTQKDFVKLSPSFKKKVTFLEIYIDWENEQSLITHLESLLNGKKT